MARRSFANSAGTTWNTETGHYFPGQGVVPPGTYQEMDTGRLIRLETENTLPASMDGRVACYRKLTDAEARAAEFRENRRNTQMLSPWEPDAPPNEEMLPQGMPTSRGVTARQIMTVPVLTVRDTMTLREVAEFLDCHNISGAPVTDGDGNLVGVVSEKDLLAHAHAYISMPRVLSRATMLYGGMGNAPHAVLREAYALGLAGKAAEVMSYPVIAAEEDDSAAHLADLMLIHRLNRIPILREGKPVGIVTREGVLRAIRLMATGGIEEQGLPV